MPFGNYEIAMPPNLPTPRSYKDIYEDLLISISIAKGIPISDVADLGGWSVTEVADRIYMSHLKFPGPLVWSKRLEEYIRACYGSRGGLLADDHEIWDVVFRRVCADIAAKLRVLVRVAGGAAIGASEVAALPTNWSNADLEAAMEAIYRRRGKRRRRRYVEKINRGRIAGPLTSKSRTSGSARTLPAASTHMREVGRTTTTDTQLPHRIQIGRPQQPTLDAAW